MADKYEPRLKTEYVSRIRGAMQEKFSYANVMMIPKLEKIVINMGVGEATADSKKPTIAAGDLAAIVEPEAGCYPRSQLDRWFQGSRRHADRREGYPSWRPHV